MYKSRLYFSNHKLNNVSVKYSTTPEIYLTIDDQNSYTQCTKKDILNYSPGLNVSADNTTTLLKKYAEKGGFIEHERCFVLRLKKNSHSQGKMEGISK